ncbi:hypothetical protein [Solemya pervernicosa gill symbiont]|nr:hypothetical protein [Solemya pervernicosa gill symbiont]
MTPYLAVGVAKRGRSYPPRKLFSANGMIMSSGHTAPQRSH